MNTVERHLPHGFGDERIEPEGLLVHSIHAGYWHDGDPFSVDAIIQLLTEYEYSYHELIDREGTAYELVPPPLRAWHAGESCWRGRRDCNSWMLGISLVGGDGSDYTDAQYRALVKRSARLVSAYPGIERENVTGHEHVSGDDVRGAGQGKTDPGPAFDWDRYRHAIDGLWRP